MGRALETPRRSSACVVCDLVKPETFSELHGIPMSESQRLAAASSEIPDSASEKAFGCRGRVIAPVR
jgi:hypothetical protein